MNLDDLLRLAPLFHVSRGESCTWQLADETLRFIDEHVTSKSQTLETGEGMSTVLFGLKGCRHTCVTPNREAMKRITNFCESHQIPLYGFSFSLEHGPGGSQKFLTSEYFDRSRATMDLVLIDGGHEFPTPFIDWYYASRKLKVGGILVIDDTQLRTVHFLKEFLLGESSRWKLIQDGAPRWAAFEKIADGFSEAWSDQKFMNKWKP